MSEARDYTILPKPTPELLAQGSEQVGLHNHSEGSFLDGYARVEQMARRAKELGQSALAITDHGEVNQHLAFQKACQAEGIKPVFGMEGYWMNDISAAREATGGKYPTEYISHLCLLARNDQGLRDLWALSSKAYDEDHFFHRPNADPALLREYGKNLYASDGCVMTGFGRAVKHGDEDAARQYLGTLQDIFRERFYVELHTWQYMHPSDDEWVNWEGQAITTKANNKILADLNAAKVRLATEMGIPMVVVNDAHHAYPEHWAFKELVWGFKKESNPDQMEGKGQKADHLMGDDELYFWMDRHGVSRDVITEAIKYSGEIAEQCNVEIKPVLEMPKFTKSEADDFEMFLEHVERGFRDKVERGGLNRDLYWARMESEVALIYEKRFAGYFLVVEDYVKAAREGTWAQWVKPGSKPEPMMIGPGRGSAGGCLVAWLLGITSIDPIKYGLLFERFLSPDRKGYPDIDIDFPRSKRKGIRDYVRKRWGEDRVCSICTMTRNQAKASVWDLARSLGIDEGPEARGDLTVIAKLVDEISATDWEEEGAESADEDNRSWADIVEENHKALAPWIRKYPALFENLNNVHGIIRSTNVHAAAVLISDKPFAGQIPTRVKNNTLMTQFDMYAVEELGGLKGDFLSLRHLDALMIAAELVKQRHGVEIDYEAWTDEHYYDPNIWGQIDDGQTVGIFQLGTPGGTDSAIEFRPRSMVDVADLIAINRPGVRDAGYYHAYLRRRAGTEPVTYHHPLMEPITANTYGILVYQEQLMQAAVALAGFSLPKADDLRKAVGKKQMDKVLALKGDFFAGCMASQAYMSPLAGYPSESAQQIAESVWISIEASGRYCFNKSHAIGYALVSHAEIWMKHYYPAEMLVGFMMVDEAKRNKYVRDARRRGLTILAPDVNESGENFTIEGSSIRYGVQAVRGIGATGAKDLVAGQPYESLEDYLKRGKRGANKTASVALAKIGGLDRFGPRDKVLKEIEYYRVTKDLAKSTLGNPEKLAEILGNRMLNDPEEYRIAIPDFDNEDVLYAIEQELIGSFVTIDPMGRYLEAIDECCIRNAAALKRYEPGQKLAIGGQIVKVRENTIKRGRQQGKKMCFLGVEWQGDIYDITIWPNVYDKCQHSLHTGAPVICVVEKLPPREDRDGGVSLVKLHRLDRIWDEENGQTN